VTVLHATRTDGRQTVVAPSAIDGDEFSHGVRRFDRDPVFRPSPELFWPPCCTRVDYPGLLPFRLVVVHAWTPLFGGPAMGPAGPPIRSGARLGLGDERDGRVEVLRHRGDDGHVEHFDDGLGARAEVGVDRGGDLELLDAIRGAAEPEGVAA